MAHLRGVLCECRADQRGPRDGTQSHPCAERTSCRRAGARDGDARLPRGRHGETDREIYPHGERH